MEMGLIIVKKNENLHGPKNRFPFFYARYNSFFLWFQDEILPNTGRKSNRSKKEVSASLSRAVSMLIN